MADSKITGLTQDTAPSLTDLMVTVKDPGGTPLSRKVTIGDALKLLQGNVIYLTNNDGVAHYAGTVVIVDTSIDNGCKKTTSLGDPKVIGIAAETVSAGASGKYFQLGQATVLVQGNVSRGAWMIASTTSGRAAQYGYLKPSSGGIGIALTGYAGGGAGTVTALISIQLSSTVNLQRLATVSTGNASFTHTTDAGTDLLIVCVLESGTADPTAITFNGVGLTKNLAATSNYNATIWYLKSPPIGSYTLSISAGASVTAEATNYAGSQATPLRTGEKYGQGASALTSITLYPASAVGDIVISILGNPNNDWVPGGGQTQLTSYQGTYLIKTSYAPGAAGTTTMSWSGTSKTYVCMAAVAIAGS